MAENKAKFIMLIGPSGAGKGSILESMLKRFANLQCSISATTRSPREGEINEQHYYFKSVEEFEEMISKGELLEYAKFTKNYYGTPKAPILKAFEENNNIIADLEVLGAKQVKENLPESAIFVFIKPPSLKELEQRLIARGTDTTEEIQERLVRAKEEIQFQESNPEFFDMVITNYTGRLEEASAKLAEFLIESTTLIEG